MAVKVLSTSEKEARFKPLAEKFKQTSGLFGKKFTTGQRSDDDRTQTVKLFQALGMQFVDDRSNLHTGVDLVVFSGGADICPVLYGQVPHVQTRYHLPRDLEEMWIARAIGSKVARIGICRGAQLLSVVNGGSMYQHIEGHAGTEHEAECYITGTKYKVNSLHHQAIAVGPGVNILALADGEIPAHFMSMECAPANIPENIVEAYHIPHARTYGIQGHPEYDSGWQDTSTLAMMIDHLAELKLAA